MFLEGGALTTTWYLVCPRILEATPPSSNLWFIEKECVVVNEGATIVTETELRSTIPETVKTMTNCFPY
ncbi:hypothetical protein Hanom_Chr09g00769291 [Helianthus anomalus]